VKDNTKAIQNNLANINTNSINTSINKATIEDNACINDFHIKSGEYCSEWVGATLKRLPLWGDNDEINFEWPTADDFALM